MLISHFLNTHWKFIEESCLHQTQGSIIGVETKLYMPDVHLNSKITPLVT